MAKKGEDRLKNILEQMGWEIRKITTEDIFAVKKDIALLVEEKDWRTPVQVKRGVMITKRGNKQYEYTTGQIRKYRAQIIESLKEQKTYLYVHAVIVFSNKPGKQAEVIREKSKAPVFVISSTIFSQWIMNLELLYTRDIIFKQ